MGVGCFSSIREAFGNKIYAENSWNGEFSIHGKVLNGLIGETI
jgi:hypothetical protein